MTAEEFAWIREHVWTGAMRKTYREMPGYFTTCACQYGTTTPCQRGDCGRCHRATPLPRPAGHVCDRTGEHVLTFPQPYEHPHQTATGRHETALAMFWHADRVCRWVCPHECHDGVGQGALFDLAVSA